LEDPNIDWRIKRELQEVGWRVVCTKFIWLRSVRWRVIVNAVMKLGFHKMWGISGLAGNHLISQKDSIPWTK
jgi:hypothetical protein